MSRLSPLFNILETENNPSPKYVDKTFGSSDSAARQLRKRAVADKITVVFHVSDRLPRKTVKLRKLKVCSMSYYQSCFIRLRKNCTGTAALFLVQFPNELTAEQLTSRSQLIAQNIPFKNAKIFVGRTPIQREKNRSPRTSSATTEYAE